MKKLSIPAIIVLILALVIAVGSQTFLGPCVHEDGSFGPCHWAGRMLLVVGALQAALALLALVLPAERPGLLSAAALTAVVGLLTPGTIISICGVDTMRCRMVMRPAMTVLCALTCIAALAGWLIERRRKG